MSKADLISVQQDTEQNVKIATVILYIGWKTIKPAKSDFWSRTPNDDVSE